MGEMPERICAWPRGLWNVGQTGTEGSTAYVRADIADGYRAALELAAIFHGDDDDMDEQLRARGIEPTFGATDVVMDRIREALAKGDEFSPPAQAENETKG